MEHTPTYKSKYKESQFTGDMFGMLAVNLVTVFVTGITFSLAYPWILCWREKWFKEHTYINGRQLYFTGTGMQLFGNWLKWVLLTIITCGIYSLWLPVKIEQWSVKHTCFADQALFAPKESEFDLVEWVKDLAGTIKIYALMIWDKLYSWVNGVKNDRPRKEKVESPGSWTCTYGHRNSADSIFCSECGERRKQERRCPVCGTPLPPKARFCGNCAHAIDVE